MAVEKNDLVKPDALESILILKKEFVELRETIGSVIEVSKKAGAAIESATSTKALREATAELTAEQIQLVKVQKQISTETAKDNEEYREQTTILKSLRSETKQKQILGEKDALTVTKLNASTEQLAAALVKNKQAYAQLRDEASRNSEAGKNLLTVIQEQKTGLDELKKSTGTVGFSEFTGTVVDMKKELKALKDELAGVASTAGVESQEFQDLAAKAGALSDEIKDIGEATKSVEGEPIEKIGQSLSFTGDKIKALDFKGATLGLKQLTASVKELSFGKSTSGLKDFGSALGGLGKAILLNPIFILAAIAVTVGLAINALKDKLFPLVKAFEFVADVVGSVIQGLKDFSDYLGLSAFAVEDNAARVIDAQNRMRDALAQRYDDEIKLANAAGKETMDAELAKQRLYIGTATIAIDQLEKVRKANGKLTEDQQKELVAQRKQLHDAEIEKKAIYLRFFKEIEDQQKKFDDEQKKRAEALAKALAQSEFDLGQFRLAQKIKELEAIRDREGNSFKVRMDAEREAQKLREEFIKNNTDHELSLETENWAKRKLIVEQGAAALADAATTSSGQIVKVLMDDFKQEADAAAATAADTKESFKTRLEAVSHYYDFQHNIIELNHTEGLISEKQYLDQLEALQENATDQLVNIELERQAKLAEAAGQKKGTAKNDDLTAQNEALGAQEESYKDYVKKVKDIEKKFRDDSLQGQLALYEEQKAILESYGKDTTAIDLQISETRLEISNNEIAKRIEGEQLLQEKLTELRQTAASSAIQIVEDQFAAADEKRQEQSDKIQADLDNQLALAGDNEEKKAQLRNKAEAEQAKLRLQQAAADRKRAIFEKAVAAVSIGINTAKGIGQALGTFPPPVSFVLAAVVAALGAVQLAAVLAKPVPQYWAGTDNHPGGLAIVGERGVEGVKEPGKPLFLTPDGPTAMDLAPGTKVFTHDEMLKGLAYSSVSPGGTRGTRDDIEGFMMLRDVVVDLSNTIRKSPKVQINFTPKGAEAAILNAQSRLEQLGSFYA